jgi:NitT/TauT family transport system substrate-binding protein
MTGINRRAFTATAALAVASPVLVSQLAAQHKPVRLLLNTSFTGPVAFLLLADDKGYLRGAGLDVSFFPGDGAAAIVPKVVAPAYDAGYGDMTALIQMIAASPPNEGPVAIYTTFNSVPFTIAVAASGQVRAPKDFEGRAISGHSTDAALVTFDMFTRATGVDPAKVRVVKDDQAMGSQVAAMLAGNGIDGVFGFVNTIIASVAPLGIDGRTQLRFLNYAEHLPDMYGNALFVTRQLYNEKAALSGLVRGLNRGLADAIANPDAAIDAVIKRNAAAPRDINRTRMVGTFESEMAHPEGRRLGIGDMDDARLSRLIDLVVAAKSLPRRPSVREVFDRSFLPPDAERIRSLGRG